MKFTTIMVILTFFIWVPPARPAENKKPEKEVSSFLDYSRPVQEQFKEWPPAELVEHSYWFPFSERAFFRAGLFGKPVFLFIDSRWNAYSHKVRQELLGDPEVLQRLNDGFITVYVNGDERPEVKERYQTGTMPVMSLLLPTGNPMITRKTPTGDARPITIGAVDKERMLFLLEQGKLYYEMKPRSLTFIGRQWADKMAMEEDPIPGGLERKSESQLLAWMEANWDREEGGIGLAPKYVLPGIIRLAQLHAARGEKELSRRIGAYLPSLVKSPLHDTVHGGIHRIAGAPEWGDIQYEKLLDRNALFLRQLVLALRESDAPSLRAAARDTAQFILGTLRAPEGWFYLAQTADFDSEDGGGYWNDPARKENPPAIDRLVLSGPVIQAGAALLQSGITLDDPAMAEAGRQAIDAVLKSAYEPGRGIRHVVAPHPSSRLYLKTQADAAFYLLDGYEATGNGDWLQVARDLVDLCRNNLRVPGEKLFIDHFPQPDPIGLLRYKRHPFPGNIQLARAMIRLSAQGAGQEYLDEAEDLLSSYAGSLAMFRVHGIVAAVALEELLGDPVKITLFGDRSSPEAIALRKAAIRSSVLFRVLINGTASGDGSPTVPRAEVVHGEDSFTTSDPVVLLQRLNRLGKGAS